MKRVIWLFLGLFFVGRAALAGVRADSVTQLVDRGQRHEIHGEIFAQGDKVRVDQKMVGIAQSTIVDYFSHRTLVLIHSRKIYVETPLTDGAWRQLVMRGQYPKPQSLQGKGYSVKVLGEEKIGEYLCRVVEVTWSEKAGSATTKLWVAEALDGLPVKTVTQSSWGMQQETVLSNLRLEKVSDDLFLPPSNYARSSSGVVGYEAPRIKP